MQAGSPIQTLVDVNARLTSLIWENFRGPYLIQKCESKIPAIKFLVLIPSTCPYKNYVPKCSLLLHELPYLFQKFSMKILLELRPINIQHFIRACILFPYIAYTRDDLCRIIRDYFQSFGKGCCIVANFLNTKSGTLLQNNSHTHLIANYLIKQTALVEISVTPTKQTTPS